MNYKGIILKIKNNTVIVMTDKSDFVEVRKQPGMYLGQEVHFPESFIVNRRREIIKYSLIAACLVLSFIAGAFALQFTPASPAYAFVSIDINPSLELLIDKEDHVIDVNTLNKDAEKLVKSLDLKNMPARDAVVSIVKKSRELGYINSKRKNTVLISAALNNGHKEYKKYKKVNEGKLDKLLGSFRNLTFKYNNENIKPVVLKVTPKERNMAEKSNISMGKFHLYNKIKADNKNVTIEDVNSSSVSTIIEEAQFNTQESNIQQDNDTQAPENTDDNSQNEATVDISPDESSVEQSSDSTDQSNSTQDNTPDSTQDNGNNNQSNTTQDSGSIELNGNQQNESTQTGGKDISPDSSKTIEEGTIPSQNTTDNVDKGSTDQAETTTDPANTADVPSDTTVDRPQEPPADNPAPNNTIDN